MQPEHTLPDYLRPGYPQRYYDRTTMGGSPAGGHSTHPSVPSKRMPGLPV